MAFRLAVVTSVTGTIQTLVNAMKSQFKKERVIKKKQITLSVPFRKDLFQVT